MGLRLLTGLSLLNRRIMKWINEPNHSHFFYRDYECRIVRHPVLGTLCGYVKIPTTHPYHAKNYNDIDIDVHGGLTFGDNLNNVSKAYEIQLDDGFWLGFDCAHYNDIRPYDINPDCMGKGLDFIDKLINSIDKLNDLIHEKKVTKSYKDFDFVTHELKSMVDQLIKAESIIKHEVD